MLAYHVSEWTQEDKALWILTNGEPNVAWIFERDGDTVYKRPMARNGGLIPPWMNNKEQVTMLGNRNKDYGTQY